jgi:hypothetical protein
VWLEIPISFPYSKIILPTKDEERERTIKGAVHFFPTIAFHTPGTDTVGKDGGSTMIPVALLRQTNKRLSKRVHSVAALPPCGVEEQLEGLSPEGRAAEEEGEEDDGKTTAVVSCPI